VLSVDDDSGGDHEGGGDACAGTAGANAAAAPLLLDGKPVIEDNMIRELTAAHAAFAARTVEAKGSADASQRKGGGDGGGGGGSCSS
jgi:hypothetical protein